MMENIFRLNGEPGHELVAVFAGRLDPEPSTTGGTLTESDGTVVPIAWRRVDDIDELIPLYPAGVNEWARQATHASQPPEFTKIETAGT